MNVGVDWAGKGWFAVGIEDGEVGKSNVFPTMWNLWREWGEEIESMLVDIPIGLATDGRRACDVAAKAYLGGSQQSSVFYTPTRGAAEALNLEAAKEEQEGADFGIQNQAWSLVPRIREVDAFVDECDEDEKIVETHPEVCFTVLAGGEASGSKKTPDGTATRIELLQEAVEFDVKAYHEKAVEDFREPSYAPMIGAEDDILDALVAAFTATLCEDEQESIGEGEAEGETRDDELGHTIEMRIPAESVST